jgi:3-isopropylmalate/(R)-2-methylmalate dehydratase small subunit
MEPISKVESKTVVMTQQNIDTDQIVPARYLKVTDKVGLGKLLFSDWRYDDKGAPRPDFILNKDEAKGAQILVAGDNFGCGSSREHAPWALVDYGFRAVISSSIADIFRNNSTKNGLVPVVVSQKTHEKLLAKPGMKVTIDLDTLTLKAEDGTQDKFPLDPFARYCLMNGVDELGFLMSQREAALAFEKGAK